MSKLLAVGTVAFDAIETPFGKTDKILGGSGTFVGFLQCLRDFLYGTRQILPAHS